VLVSSENGGDDDEHIATPRCVQSRSILQSNANHEVRHSPIAVSSTRPTSGRTCQPASLETSNADIRPTGSPTAPHSLSYIETPQDISHETINNRELTESPRDTADTSSRCRVVTLHDHTSCTSVAASHNSNIQSSSSMKAAVIQESVKTSIQSGHRDKPRTSRLAVLCDIFCYQLKAVVCIT